MWPVWPRAHIATHGLLLCCSLHFLLLFPCYLPFLITVVIRQLVDWLVNVCTTLQTCIVPIQRSLLLLLCFCLFFLAFMMHLSLFLLPLLFLPLLEVQDIFVLVFFTLAQRPHRIPISSALPPCQGMCFLLQLLQSCCPITVYHCPVHRNLKSVPCDAGIQSCFTGQYVVDLESNFNSCNFLGSLAKGKSTLCLWKSSCFPAVLNQEYRGLTFKLLLQLAWS